MGQDLDRLGAWRPAGALGGLLLLVAAQGCALSLGAGVSLTVDTRGTVGVLANLSADPWAVRIEPKESPDYEESISLLPLALAAAGGVQVNPGAWLLRIDSPGLLYTWNRVRGERPQGAVGTISPRLDLRWPFSGGFNWAIGGALKGGWMSQLSVTQHPRLAARPEWPDGWVLHQIGPVGEIGLMHDREGWYGQLGIGAMYRYQNYFYLGL